MFQTVTYNSVANRFAPHSDYVDFEGFDFSGATAKLQVRDRKNGGALRADIVPTFALLPGAETVTTRMSWVISEANPYRHFIAIVVTANAAGEGGSSGGSSPPGGGGWTNNPDAQIP